MSKKNKLKSRQAAAKKKKIRHKEQEDSTGVKRRKRGDKPELSPLVFYSIKGGLILFTLFCYFQYSILLLPLFLIYVSLYYFSFWVERHINRNYNFENKKKVFRVDSGIAFITVIVSIASSIFTFSRMPGNRGNSISMYARRICSLSTGVRNIFEGSRQMGMGERPEGFKPPGDGSGGRPNRTDFNISDLPIEFAFNQILSSIILILLFGVLVLGAISTGMYFYKTFIYSKKLSIKENTKNEWVFSQEDLQRILSEEI